MYLIVLIKLYLNLSFPESEPEANISGAVIPLIRIPENKNSNQGTKGQEEGGPI